MANFNEKVNCSIGYILNSQEFFIYKAGTIEEFARMIHDELYLLTNTYRLFIQYKTTHRAKKMAGRCFLWDNSHGDHMADPGNGIELRSLNDASQDDCEGFGNPRFDGMESAILITDRHVFVYGDVQIEAADISLDKKHVFCEVSLCGCIVSYFRIPAQTFDRHFGLQENLPKQRAFGFNLFNTDKCLEDIKLVKISINSAIGFMKYALQNLDEAKASIERDAGIGDDGWSSLQFAQIAIDESLNSTLVSLNEISGIFGNADKLRLRNDMETPRTSIRNK